LRDRLLVEIEDARREEDLGVWFMRSWRDANALASADGVRVREAFAARLDELRRPEQSSSEQVAQPARQAELSSHGNDAVALPKMTRQRDRQHLRLSNSHAWCVAGGHAIRINALPKPAGSDKSSVMSSPTRSAVPITASCIAPERKWNGGRD
jgi:hypothetical protein